MNQELYPRWLVFLFSFCSAKSRSVSIWS